MFELYKVVVIDDEEWIREGLINKIKKSGLDFTAIAEAENADDGLQIIQALKPEIIICDIRMQEMDGLTLSETVTQILPNTKIIIISGYDQFDYAKKALQLGVADFLLKPINSEDLVHSLQKCIAAIAKQNSERQKLAAIATLEQLDEARSRFLKYLNGQDGQLHDIFSAYRAGQSVFKCIYLYINPQVRLNKDSLIATVFHPASPWQCYRNAIMYENNINEYALIFCVPVPAEPAASAPEDPLADVAAVIAALVRRLGIHDYTLGISGYKPNPGEAVNEAVTAMKYRVLIAANQIIDYQDTVAYKRKFRLQTQSAALLQHNLRAHHYANLAGVLQDIYDEASREPLSYGSLQNLYTNLLLLGLDEFDQYQEDKAAFYPKEAYCFNNLRELFEFIKEVYRSIIATHHPEDKDYKRKLIYEVKQYIDANYNKSFTLESIAAMQHINFCYLSMLFKEILNVNFQNYLMSVRIDHAKALLNLNKYTIKQVANMTGFADEHYFSKVFKKVEGLPPKEFLKKMEEKEA